MLLFRELWGLGHGTLVAIDHVCDNLVSNRLLGKFSVVDDRTRAAGAQAFSCAFTIFGLLTFPDLVLRQL